MDMYEIMMSDELIEKFNSVFKKTVAYFKDNKTKYKEVVKTETLMGWFIGHKVYEIHPNNFPITRGYKDEIDLKEFDIFHFFRNNKVIFTSKDALVVIKKYLNNPKAVILCDPPYLKSDNSFYKNTNMDVYDWVSNNLNNLLNAKSKIYFILEGIKEVRVLFNSFKKTMEYKKYYEISKKETKHIVYQNN